MKKWISLLAFTVCASCGFAQEPVLSFDGELYFIPGSMTKEGEAFLVSVNSSKRLTIYDGDFNVVGEFTEPSEGQPYQQRVVTLTRVCDPGTSAGPNTRSDANEEWTVVDDQTYDYTMSSTISSFEVYSDDNNYHSRQLYVSQTLFDDDDDFELVRTRKTIVPINVKMADYIREHSTGNAPTTSISWGDEKIDSIMTANGADSFDWIWDDESGKRLMRLYKHENYGGIYSDGMEVVTLDGTVKAFLPDITSLSSSYYYRGKCYVQGYNSKDNSRVLYLLGNGVSEIREVSRDRAVLLARRVGNNLLFDSDSDGQQTIVMSTMDGRIVRSLQVQKGSNYISLNGLQGGVYTVTLYRQSMPMKSSKIIIK